MLHLPANELRPQAMWIREPQADVWVWVPLFENTGTDDQQQALSPESWQFIVPERLVFAFQLSEKAHLRLPNTPAKLYSAQLLPPPQFGEAALIADEDGWRKYSLAALDPEARRIWQQMSDLLKALAAPAAWWPYDALLEVCSTPESYEAHRNELQAQLLKTREASDRQKFKTQLRQLERARQQAEALTRMITRHHQQREAYQAQVQRFIESAQKLANFYLDAHQAAKQAGGSTGVIDAPMLTGLLLESPAKVEGNLPRGKRALAPRGTPFLAEDFIEVPAYQEDTAVREATLAGPDYWTTEDDVYRFASSPDDLAIYFGDPKHPMSVTDAIKRLHLLGDSTVLTARIALGLWNQRRREGRLSKNGDAALRYDEILAWRGIEKLTRATQPGGIKKHSDGYRDSHKKQVRQDLELLQHYYLRGSHTVRVKGRVMTIRVDGPYLRVGPVTAEIEWKEADVGVYLSPGPWVNSYEDYDNWTFAEIDRRIFELVPQNDQHELRLALYLVERWRQQAQRQTYAEPIVMEDLLTASVITIDRKHLTDRFVKRIHDALDHLCRRKIIGSCVCLTPVDEHKPQWGKDWLASVWQILPPEDLIQQYRLRLPGGGRRELLPDQTGERYHMEESDRG